MNDFLKPLKEYKIALFFIIMGILGYIGAIVCGIIKLIILL